MEKATGATHPNPSSQAGLDDRSIEGGGDMATGSHGRAILGYTVIESQPELIRNCL